MELLKKFWNEEEGQDLIEYALLLGFITLAVITTITGMSASLNTIYFRTNSFVAEAAK